MIQGREYNDALVQRILLLMEICGLGISLFAELINISESHLYSVLNSNRNVSLATIDKIKQALPFKKGDFTQLNKAITYRNIDIGYLNKFKDENKHRIKEENVLDFSLNTELGKKEGIFNIPISIKQISHFLFLETGKKYQSKSLSQKLTYWSTIGKIKRERGLIQLNNGQSGKRNVYFYWKENP